MSSKFLKNLNPKNRLNFTYYKKQATINITLEELNQGNGWHLYIICCPSTVVPDIECDVRAGKINLPEFIVKCPAHCKETKQQVYGTGVFASISSICNAAIHR